LFYANKYQKATERYDNIVYDPSYLKALLNKGIALSKLGKYKEAIKWYDKALLIVVLRPLRNKAYLNLD
jgi:tetratricopeptide (TPR) repeat protein